MLIDKLSGFLSLKELGRKRGLRHFILSSLCKSKALFYLYLVIYLFLGGGTLLKFNCQAGLALPLAQ